MAVVARNKKAAPASNGDKEKAAGFANLSVVDTEGREHRLQNGVALFDSKRVDRSILNRYRAAEEAGEEEFELTFKVRVNLVTEDSDEDIAL